MGNDIATQQHDRGLHKAGDASDFTPAERDTLRSLGGLDEASDGDLKMLATVSKRTGLDPFTKEIYLVGRKTKTGGYRGDPVRWETKWTVQTGIEGFRKATHRYAESKGLAMKIGKPVYYEEDGTVHPFWLKKWGTPAAAEVEIMVGENSAYGIATWEEYAQTTSKGELTHFWEKFGPTMLAKCAESAAHRKICPLTAGLYSNDEMYQADARAMRVDRQPYRQQQPQRANASDPRGMDLIHQALEEKKQANETVAEIEPAPAVDVSQIVEVFQNQIAGATTTDQLQAVMADVTADSGLGDEQQKLIDYGRARWAELAQGENHE